MIWYDMEQYGMIWYLIDSQLLKLFAYYLSAEMSMRHALKNINFWFPKKMKKKTFTESVKWIFCERIFSSDCNIMRMLFPYFTSQSLIFIRNIYYSSSRPVFTFYNKKSHCFKSMIVKNHCFLLMTICFIAAIARWFWNVLKVQVLNSLLLCNPLLIDAM